MRLASAVALATAWALLSTAPAQAQLDPTTSDAAAHLSTINFTTITSIDRPGKESERDELALFRRSARPAAASESIPTQAVFMSIDDAIYRSLDPRGHHHISIADFALAPDRSVTLDLESFQVLSADALVVAGTADGDVPIAYEVGLFLRGSVRGMSESFVYLSIFPGYAMGYVEMPLDASGAMLRFLIAPLSIADGQTSVLGVCDEQFLPAEEFDEHFCSTNDEPLNEGVFERIMAEMEGQKQKGRDEVQINEETMVAYVAIDCDYEYYGDHSDNISRTVNYSLSVMGASSAVYDRDLNFQLHVPYIRVWTSVDPYPGNNTSSLLSQVRTYWNANMGHVERSLVHLFSGATGGGRAYIAALCGSVQYAVSGVGWNSTFPPTGYLYDIYLVAHETGHNFAANHTQNCFWSPPIDSCSLGGGGTSCLNTPIPREGTIMSYCGNRRNYFHPRVSTYMRNYAEPKACVHKLESDYADDLAVLQFSAPAQGGIYAVGSGFTPTARFANLGSNAQSNVTMTYEIQTTSGTVFFSSTRLVASMAAGAEFTISFDPVTLSSSGTFLTIVTINLGGDENPINNSLTRPFQVVPSVAGSITLDAPNGLDTLCADTTYYISWTYSGAITDVRIEWTPDDGDSWYDVISKTAAAPGSYAWRVPSITTDRARVRIMDRLNSATSDVSDFTFRIVEKNDIQPIEFINPVINAGLHPPFRPIVRVRNNGTEDQKDVPVRIRIRHRVLEHDVYNRTLTLARLNAGESKTVVFPKATGFPSATSSNYDEFLIYARALHSGDTDPWNDSLSRYFDIDHASAIATAGDYHSMALLPSDGSVWTWGHNFYGQLGNGSNSPRSRPVRMLDIRGAVDIAGGGYTSFVLLADGNVWSCGYGYYGQLGTGSTVNANRPARITALSNIVEVSAGRYHGLALESDGTVWAWGRNNYGQLGDGTSIQRNTPVDVKISDVVALAAGEWHSYALKADGTVWAWGRNIDGQLGNGSNFDSKVPVQVSNISSALAIAAGDDHGVALLADGNVNSWGDNSYGQLGDGTSSDSNIPLLVASFSNGKTVSAGRYHSTALKNDGTVWSWGRNNYGQLGDNSFIDRSSPVQATGVTDAVDLGENGWHSILVNEDGQICASGYNFSGQVGDGTTVNRDEYTCQNAFEAVVQNRFTSGGYYHSVAIKVNSGRAYAWGRNNNGQLGNGSFTDSPTPVLVNTVTNVLSVATGAYHNFAIRDNGELWAWGHSGDGKLGIGPTTDRNSPVQVTGVSNVIGASASVYHSAAVTADGRVYTWGDNSQGQLGDGTMIDRDTPVLVGGITNVIAVSAGLFHTMALKNDGTVWAWGWNNNGQIGDGSTTANYTTPQRVNDIELAIGIGAGLYHSMALLNNGEVLTWGSNIVGQLGDGTTTGRNLPGLVTGIRPVAQIARGAYHSAILLDGGAVQGWGYNVYGQLGEGSFTSWFTSPVTADGVVDAVQLGERNFHGILHRGGGDVCAAGWNNYGQLGDGGTLNQNVYTCLTTSFLKQPFLELPDDARLLPGDAPEAPVGSLLRVFPNPGNGLFMLEGIMPEEGVVLLTISDALGREVYRQRHEDGGGLTETIDLRHLARGVYHLRLVSERGTLADERIILR